MRFAYGTYATPTLSLEETIPLLSKLGYSGIEICIGNEPFNTLPDQIDPARRQRLRDLLAAHHLDVAALMIIGRSVLGKGDEDHHTNLEEARKAARLARDLGVEGTPILAMGFGGKADLWSTQRDQIVARLADYARLAADIFTKWFYPHVYVWLQQECDLRAWLGMPLPKADDPRIAQFAERNATATGEIETTHHVAWVAGAKR